MSDQDKKEVKHVADIVGEYGRWQFHMCCFYIVQNALGAINNLGYAFHAFNHEFWCSDVPIDYQVILNSFLLKQGYDRWPSRIKTLEQDKRDAM